MGAAKLLTAAGGGITLDAASTATDKTITVPADNGTLIYANSSGNVGIGTSSPGYKLDTQANTYQVAQFKNTNASGGDAQITLTATQSGSGGAVNSNANFLAFQIASSEKARIDSSGRLLVGRTSNTDSATLQLSNESGGSNIAMLSVAGTTGDSYPCMFRNPNGQVGAIRTNGSSTAYNTSSDYRLKENIQPMQNALAVVQQLSPVTYTWKTDGSNGQGFIAHELQEVVPDCVTGEKDAVETYLDEEGNEQTRPVYQGIDTSFLVATLTAAIQELSAKNDALEARLTALENK